MEGRIRREFIDTFTGLEEVTGEGNIAVDALVKTLHAARGLSDATVADRRPEYIIMPRADMHMNFFVRIVRNKETPEELTADFYYVEDPDENMYLIDMDEPESLVEDKTTWYAVADIATFDMQRLKLAGMNYTIKSN